MFESIGFFKLLRIVLYLNAVLALAIANDFLGVLPNIPPLSAVSISVLSVSALVLLVGQTAMFPMICRLPLMWHLFPNIDGTYEVEISSNWSTIEARAAGREAEVSPDGDVGLFNKMGEMKITVRLTRIDVSLRTNDGYLTSEAPICSLQKKRGERMPKLFYIFESSIRVPKQTDSTHHLGAAQLDIPTERQPLVLEGHYWTDRNWHKGLNTAGHIRLTRKT